MATLDTPNETDLWARRALVVALLLAVLGILLEHYAPTRFWGGLVRAFGEAALVGGLADWFAVRALFAHPFGIPFPHTALIPRNRERIVGSIRSLVQDEWLPPSLLKSKVQSFDFVGSGLLPVVEPLKPHLREVLRSLGRDVLADLEPRQLAEFLARGLAGAADADRVGTFLADLVARARAEGWLGPLLREWVARLQQWAASPSSQEVIRHHLEQAAVAYRDRGWFKSMTFKMAERFGGIDLNQAAEVLQAEVRRFAAEQMGEQGQLHEVVEDGLRGIERRLREEPAFLADVRAFVFEGSGAGNLALVLEPVLASLREQGRRELERPESPFLDQAMRHLDGWLQRLAKDAELRAQVNAWCRRLAVTLVEENHPLIGALVEEQLNRLSSESLSEVIQAKVGDDLNWIRLNGTFVGGLVGAFLYLSFTLLRTVLPR